MRRDEFLVRSSVIFEFVQAHHPLVPAQVELRYSGADPYAVAVAFQTARSDEVVWRFSRGLLAQGLVAAAGEGDVRLRPVHPPFGPGGTVEIELRSPGGRAVFRASDVELAGFLGRTLEVVGWGREHEWLDLDHAVTMLCLARP